MSTLASVNRLLPLLPAALPIALFLILWVLLYLPLGTVARAARSLTRAGAARALQSRFGKWAVKQSVRDGLRPYAPVLLLVAIGAVAAFVAGFGFVELSERLRLTASAVYRLDQFVESWFQHARQPGWTILFSACAAVGGTIGMWTLGAAVSAVLLYRGERPSAAYVLVTIVGGALVNLGLKALFARARPDLSLAIAPAQWYSFPSGHAMSSFIACGAVSYIAMRQRWPWKVKSAALAAAATIVVLVGLSRVYLGVHWASDIAGGWAAATVWLAATTIAFEMLLVRLTRSQ
jgi:undecaprenyl-diphosphatase